MSEAGFGRACRISANEGVVGLVLRVVHSGPWKLGFDGCRSGDEMVVV